MKLAAYLEKQNLSDDDFAALVGRHRTTILRWRNGGARPDWDALHAIEEATGGKVTARDFLGPKQPSKEAAA